MCLLHSKNTDFIEKLSIVNCFLHSARPKIKIVYTAPKLQVCTNSDDDLYRRRYMHIKHQSLLVESEGFD